MTEREKRAREIYGQEALGSIPAVSPITPRQILAASDGNISYEHLAALLSKYGLEIGNVVHDETRVFLNTYYADWQQGLYCQLDLRENDFDKVHEPVLLELAGLKASGNQSLLRHDWINYYETVPLPLQSYDFQNRLYTIEPEVLFETWYFIYKHINYSNNAWRAETLDYVFTHAPQTDTPKPESNGFILIYRGMGDRSLPPEEALSWSTHPGNALWFAIQGGHGTQMVTAEVRPEDVIIYAPGYFYENEVLVRPHTVRNIQDLGMIPATQENCIQMIVPILLEFRRLGQQARKFGYREKQGPILSSLHSIDHILRVLCLSLIYFHYSSDLLSADDKNILIYFSILHDVARTNDDENSDHGDAAVELIQRRGLKIKGVQLTKKDYRIAEFIIRYHCHEDEDGVAAIRNLSNFSRKDKERIKKLYYICKDMDALDRVRFNGLDYRQLRTAYAKKLPLFVGALLEEDILGFLDLKFKEANNSNV